jgi:hypothetical protein
MTDWSISEAESVGAFMVAPLVSTAEEAAA